MMKRTIYTIGYTSFSIDEFVRVLKRHGIGCVVDVRSVPRSSYYTDYDEVSLKETLRENEILYRNYAREFGARQKDASLYPNGYLDFEKFAASEAFREGLNKVAAGYERGYTFALMCAEKDPFNCHRCILVGRQFKEHGYEVLHLEQERTETQEDIEDRLLAHYFPNRNQLSLFDTRSDQELLEEAYRKRNAEIGYHIEEE